jgi:hypothetical protein
VKNSKLVKGTIVRYGDGVYPSIQVRNRQSMGDALVEQGFDKGDRVVVILQSSLEKLKKECLKIHKETDACPDSMTEDDCNNPDREGSCSDCWKRHIDSLV